MAPGFKNNVTYDRAGDINMKELIKHKPEQLFKKKLLAAEIGIADSKDEWTNIEEVQIKVQPEMTFWVAEFFGGNLTYETHINFCKLLDNGTENVDDILTLLLCCSPVLVHYTTAGSNGATEHWAQTTTMGEIYSPETYFRLLNLDLTQRQKAEFNGSQKVHEWIFKNPESFMNMIRTGVIQLFFNRERIAANYFWLIDYTKGPDSPDALKLVPMEELTEKAKIRAYMANYAKGIWGRVFEYDKAQEWSMRIFDYEEGRSVPNPFRNALGLVCLADAETQSAYIDFTTGLLITGRFFNKFTGERWGTLMSNLIFNIHERTPFIKTHQDFYRNMIKKNLLRFKQYTSPMTLNYNCNNHRIIFIWTPPGIPIVNIKYKINMNYSNFMKIVNKYSNNMDNLRDILTDDGLILLRRLEPVMNLDAYDAINKMENDRIKEATTMLLINQNQLAMGNS